jgi:hypothetical protein
VATPYIAPLPPDTGLTSGDTVQFVAIDPTTGNAVSGVTISNVSIYVDSSGNATLEQLGPFLRVPGPGA